MFEQNPKAGWRWSWTGIFVIAALVIGGLFLVKVNPPESVRDASATPTPVWTTGSILSGPAELPAGGLLTFALDLNHKTTFNGYFRTGDNEKKVGCTIIKKDDLDKWKAGMEVPIFTDTGPVPRGTIKRVFDAGRYLLILDNRSNPEPIRLIETDFSVE